ncbi:MAG: DUF1254 domain-containing protein [bacterium]
MKGSVRWLIVTAVLAVAVLVVAVRALPYAIMAMATRGAAARGEWNHAYNPPLATAAARSIVRPSPDLAYTSCAFDVVDKGLAIDAPLGGADYASLSMFASNTDNFFVLNDRAAGSAPVQLLLVGPRTPAVEAAGRTVVHAPSDRGMVLVRRVVSGPQALPAVDALRNATHCTPQ